MSEKHIKTPHLPQGRVGLAVLGEKYRTELAGPLERQGVDALWSPENTRVDRRLSGHADLCLFHAGGSTVVSSAGETVNSELERRGFDVRTARNEVAGEYPGDAGLNGCLLGKRFLHNLKVSDPELLAALPGDIRRINLRQGYARCSVCVVDEGAAVTSDLGLARAAGADGVSVLLIRPGFIELSGFEYGFIGGASFKLSEGELAFTGRLEHHPDWERIESFLLERGVRPVFLTDKPAFDIGSAVPLMER